MGRTTARRSFLFRLVLGKLSGMDARLEELLEAPDLPLRLQAWNEAFAEEQARRERFYDEMTPDRRVEFINGKIVMHSPAKWRHADTMGFLYMLLAS